MGYHAAITKPDRPEGGDFCQAGAEEGEGASSAGSSPWMPCEGQGHCQLHQTDSVGFL